MKIPLKYYEIIEAICGKYDLSIHYNYNTDIISITNKNYYNIEDKDPKLGIDYHTVRVKKILRALFGYSTISTNGYSYSIYFDLNKKIQKDINPYLNIID